MTDNEKDQIAEAIKEEIIALTRLYQEVTGASAYDPKMLYLSHMRMEGNVIFFPSMKENGKKSEESEGR